MVSSAMIVSPVRLAVRGDSGASTPRRPAIIAPRDAVATNKNPPTKKPATITVVRRNREHVYALADEKDWGIMNDNTVLSIDVADGTKVYWPLDSVIRWSVK